MMIERQDASKTSRPWLLNKNEQNFILPSQLFCNFVKTADSDENLNEHLSSIFRSIEASAVGTASEDDLRGLFSDFSVDSALLGSTVIKRNQLLAKVLKTVAEMDLGSKYNDTDNDTFGDTYEFLMQMYASQAGKSVASFSPHSRCRSCWRDLPRGTILKSIRYMIPLVAAVHCC